MYQTSLSRFLDWFDNSLQEAEQASNLQGRVRKLIDFLTYCVYQNVDLGLFEKDKLVFKLMVVLKLLTTQGTNVFCGLSHASVRTFLRGGDALETVDLNPHDHWLHSR